jgi:lysophospholipase L1-like esterase
MLPGRGPSVTDLVLEEPPIPASRVARRRLRTPSKLTWIVTCAVLVGVLAGCVVVAERRSSAGRRVVAARRVVFVGDSITADASPQIADAATTHRYSAYVYAFPGLLSAQIDSLLRWARSQHPGTDATVLNAGTNDVIFDTGPGWKRKFDALVARAKTPCVVLTTVSTRLDDHHHTPTARQVNDRIRRFAADHDNVRVVDWDARIRSGASVTVSDGIHPNAAGRRWIAAQDLVAVRSCDG